MNVDGKTAVVTGGATGIGAALARQLASRGANVIIADYDLPGAEKTAGEIGNGASAVQFDAANIESVDAMADKVWAQTGGVDLVFANAGVSSGAPLLHATQEQFDWHFAVNTRGVWATAKAFLNKIIAAERPGHLTITASEHSLGLQHVGAGVYTSTKHAVLGLAEVLRAETPETVGVSAFCPGLVATQLYDASRFGVVPEAPAEMKALGAAVMGKGMSADDVAKAAVDGTERGDFYIVTHATAFPAAERRYQEIKAAFDAQAPMTEEAKKYEVNNVVAAVLSELGGQN